MALEENGLNPIETGKIEVVTDIEEGQPFAYQVTFELKPNIDLPELNQITFHKDKAEITNEDVQYQIEKLRQQYAQMQDLDKAAEQADYVVIDYQGYVKDDAIEQLQGEQVTIKLDDNDMPQEFNEAIVGLSAGDATSVKVKYPKDHENEQIAGKKVHFAITLHKVQGLQLPELDDSFAQNIEGMEFSTLEELRQHITELLTDQIEQNSTEDLKSKILQYLEQSSDFPLPESLVEQERQRLKNTYESNEQNQQVPSDEELDQQARSNVTKGLIFNAYLEANHIELDRQKVDEYISSMAQQFGIDAETLKKVLSSREQDLEQIENNVLREQGLEDMLSKVNIAEHPVSAKQYEDKMKNHNQEES
jgi:trigger factor